MREQPQRPINYAGGQAFLSHQRQPDFQGLRALAWEAGLVMVLYTDAAGEVGWGVSCGDTWHQGRWSPSEMHKNMNWKKLKAYGLALERSR